MRRSRAWSGVARFLRGTSPLAIPVKLAHVEEALEI